MNLTHHDSRDYASAAAHATEKTRQKFQKRIDEGRAQGAQVIEAILSNTPQDIVAESRALTFGATEQGDLLLKILNREEDKKVHENALRQICEREGVPPGYLKDLLVAGEWGRNLAVRTLNDVARHRNRRALLRSVGNEVRGFLSDQFRRLDSRPLVEAFAKACMAVGALPIGGRSTDLRVALQAIYPEVIEIDGDPLLFGLQWQNSDFGVGGHEIKLLVERLWCTNLATRENVLRQVHLGRRLPDDIALSQRTYDLDTRATASAVTDIVSAHISKEAVQKEAERIRTAAATKVDEKKAKALLDDKLNKGEVKQAIGEWAQNPNVEELPQGATIWRLSNAVSWIAKGATPDRRIELEEVAGWLLNSAKAA